jgi:hypothetical protein
MGLLTQHLKSNSSWAPVAHTCNPSYSEGRDQEDGVQSLPGQIVHEIFFFFSNPSDTQEKISFT